jgi:hypothetical protein
MSNNQPIPEGIQNEIAAEAERDIYRKALEDIIKLSSPYQMFDVAKRALDQYPSPKDKDNEASPAL